VLAYSLSERTGASNFARWVWGEASRSGGSAWRLAIALDRLKIERDGFEGLMLLIRPYSWFTMIVGMNAWRGAWKAENRKNKSTKHDAKSEGLRWDGTRELRCS